MTEEQIQKLAEEKFPMNNGVPTYLDKWEGFVEGYKAAMLQNKGECISDAIEFKKWCDSGKAWFFDNNEQHTHTTEELYQKFLENKPAPPKQIVTQ